MFTNLIGNAVKFGGPEVRVTIRVEERELASVEDNGPGIPDEEKSYLFARFNGGDNEKNSRRLGLYICRTLIERYGGGDLAGGTGCRGTPNPGRPSGSRSGRPPETLTR